MSGLGLSIYQDGVNSGLQQGIQQGSLTTLIDLVRDGMIRITDAAKKANMTEEDFSELLKESK